MNETLAVRLMSGVYSEYQQWWKNFCAPHKKTIAKKICALQY